MFPFTYKKNFCCNCGRWRYKDTQKMRFLFIVIDFEAGRQIYSTIEKPLTSVTSSFWNHLNVVTLKNPASTRGRVNFRNYYKSLARCSAQFHTGPPSLLHDGYRVSYPRIKWPGRVVNHTLPSSAEAKERVQLYLYSHLGLHMACSRTNFTFTFYCKTHQTVKTHVLYCK